MPKPSPMKRPPKKGPYCKYHGAKGHHTNECIVLCDSLEAEVRKGNLEALLEWKEKMDPVVEPQDTQAWQKEVMKRQAEANVIIIEVDESLSVDTVVDYGIDPLEFHLTNMKIGDKSNVDLATEDPAKAESSNTDRSLNALYGIDAPHNAGKLNRVVEVLALLKWSKDQASRLRSAGTAL